MKIIKFFCLLSLIAILASALAEDAIVQTHFYKKYLDESVVEANQQLINTAELPSEVMAGFLESPFKDLSIHEVHKVEGQATHNISLLVKKMIQEQPQETLYVLSLADKINNDIQAVLSFSPQGKLLNIKKN